MLKNNYIINLARRGDRWLKVQNKIQESNMKHNNFIRFEAFDGEDAFNELNRFNAVDTTFIRFMAHSKITTTKGYFGVHMSHMYVYKAIAENDDIKDDEYVGIYEDDFFMSDNFDDNYNNLLNTDLHRLGVDMIFLGGRYTPNWEPKSLAQFEKTDHPNVYLRKVKLQESYNVDWERTAHAYVVKKSICADLYKKMNEVSFYIHNNKISLRAIDHAIIMFDKFYKLYDWFPHLYYVPINYDSNVQGENLTKVINFSMT